MNKLDNFLKEHRSEMRRDLRELVTSLQNDIKRSQLDYTESIDETPSIDIRLCIDLTETPYRSTGWLFRVGNVDYDPYHSEYCSASYVTLDTDSDELFNELVEGL